MSTVRLRHQRVELALHCLREADGPRLLLLHGLGEQSPSCPPDEVAPWPGSIHALDFTGHGQSTVPRGGGYTAEVLMGDVDVALAHLGSCTVVGYGLGAYIALLIAGARPALVRGIVLCDGSGFRGGPPLGAPLLPHRSEAPSPLRAPDPAALLELWCDPRPPDYAVAFARLAVEGSDLDEPITAAAGAPPPWLVAVAGEFGVRSGSVADALNRYAQSSPT